jgi:uncharacterized protein YkwD
MKKTLLLTLTSLIITLSNEAFALTNLLSNAGFANKLSSWKQNGSSSAITGTHVHTGTYSGRVGKASGTLYQIISKNLEAEKSYHLSFYGKLSASSTVAKISIRQRDSLGRLLQTDEATIPTTTYTQISKDFTYQKQAKSVSIIVVKSGATGYAYVDDFSLTENEATTTTPTPPSPSWTVSFMSLVNDHRGDIGLKALTHVDDLGAIATTHSSNMASGSVEFGHKDFTSRCAESRVALGGGNWCGENVASGQKTPEAAFKAWMNSPGHKANIENTRSTHTGFGYAKNSSGAYYWTQIFVEKK